ncbi:MAG: hypothetical protein EXS00_05490 [Phycisphaerales bacterium]|nr:hypothetical protein [Phycisphaerales bacterium]
MLNRPPRLRAAVLVLFTFGSLSASLFGAASSDRQDQGHKHHHEDETPADAGGAPPADGKHGHAHDAQAGGISWYVTLHGDKGGNSVVGLSESGDVVEKVLGSAPDSVGSTKDLRGMAHLADGSLLVVNAFKNDTRLLRYGPTGADGVRPFIEVFAGYSAEADPALVHTYAVVVGADGTIYASDQDTNTVTRFGGVGSAEKGSPVPSPHSLQSLRLSPGVLIPARTVSPSGLVEVRGLLTMPDGTIAVADKGAHRVAIYDSSTGAITSVIADESRGLKSPIQLVLNEAQTKMYIGDNEAHCIFVVDLSTRAVTVFAGSGVCPDEPSALTIRGENLFVGDRKSKSILRFDLTTPGVGPQVWAKKLPDAPEFLLRASDG